MNKKIVEDKKIGIIGLGYVGLPLATEFGKFVLLWDLISVNHV